MRAALERLLGTCVDRVSSLRRRPPLLVKLAPDLTPEALDEAVDVAIAAGVSGIVATNTTISRPPWPRTIRNRSDWLAPSAIRTPISCRRWETRKAITL